MSCNCTNNDSNCQNCFGGITIPQGPIGPKGDDGEQGLTGLTGATGPQGDKGDNGADSGVPGPQGPQGDPGPQGEIGPEGPAGNDGANGPQGLPGTEGVQGVQGIQGAQGDPGVNSTVFDNYLSDFAISWDVPLASTLIPGAALVVGSGTGNYLINYDLYLADNTFEELVLKINGIVFETIDLTALRNDGNHFGGHVITNVDDGNSVELWASGTDGFSELIEGFKFSTIRLG